MTARGAPVLALVLLCCAGVAALAACAPARLGGRDSAPPAWRRPGPAADGPIERRVVPDDGFADHLAAADSRAPLPPA